MDIEYIISHYFSFTEKDEANFKEWFSRILNEGFSFINNGEKHPLHGELLPHEVSILFRTQDIPAVGEGISAVLKEALSLIVQNSVRLGHPNYIGHMTQICPNFALLCDFIISFLNQNLVKIETALSATYVEWQTISWLHKLVYKHPESFYTHILDNADSSLGNMCSGGTNANLTALTVARNHSFPQLHKIGLFAAYKEANCTSAVILVSKRGHYSIKKAAAIIGIGEQNVIEIPCVPFTNQINLVELKKTIRHLNENHTKIICLVGIAGSTETGSVDDLSSLAQISQEHNIWFHVDAAWGGALLMSQKYSHLLSGIEQADSVCLDGHKFFYLTISHSIVLFKNQTSLNHIRHSANYIIREGSVDLGRTSIEGSRRFDSFKLWFALKVLGKNGYELLINEAIEKGNLFSHIIEQHKDFELTSRFVSGILTYRFIPQKIKKLFLSHKNNENFSTTSKEINLILNKINTDIQKKQRGCGNSFVSRTVLESFFPGQEIVVLRAIPFNPLTTHNILADILSEQAELGNTLIKNEKSIAINFISP
ncbi:MAG: pyridoxal-dependent decarboxylase [Bdellovibrionota bacterium]